MVYYSFRKDSFITAGRDIMTYSKFPVHTHSVFQMQRQPMLQETVSQIYMELSNSDEMDMHTCKSMLVSVKIVCT